MPPMSDSSTVQISDLHSSCETGLDFVTCQTDCAIHSWPQVSLISSRDTKFFHGSRSRAKHESPLPLFMAEETLTQDGQWHLAPLSFISTLQYSLEFLLCTIHFSKWWEMLLMKWAHYLSDFAEAWQCFAPKNIFQTRSVPKTMNLRQQNIVMWGNMGFLAGQRHGAVF